MMMMMMMSRVLPGIEQIEDLKQLCKLGSRTPGHPENVTTAGIEVTTGICAIQAKSSIPMPPTFSP